MQLLMRVCAVLGIVLLLLGALRNFFAFTLTCFDTCPADFTDATVSQDLALVPGLLLAVAVWVLAVRARAPRGSTMLLGGVVALVAALALVFALGGFALVPTSQAAYGRVSYALLALVVVLIVALIASFRVRFAPGE